MKTIASSALLLTLFVMVTNLHAAQPAHPLPPGIGRYILVLKVVDERPGTPKTITEPDVAKLGGKVLIKHENRRVIELPTAAAKALRNDSSVAYVQRVWMGEPLNGWDERDLPSGAAFKAQSDDVAGTGLSWSSGTYQYDPSSNIKAIGSDTYKYDTANRLVQAVVAGQTETYGYDSFGNLTQKTLAGQPSTVPAIDPSSNRIAGESYDAAGNVTTNGSRITYEFDSAGAMTDMTTKAGQRRRMIYTADDERIGTETDSSMIRWTFRDINSSKVLREFQDAYGSGEWEWTEDYIYAGGTLVGAETEQFWGGRRHFHLDHLGSVRMITSDVGTRYSRNDFYPFGAEQTSSVQEATNFGYWRSDPMKFTGHEREYYGMSNVDNSDYLDYMHARYYSPHMGRFLSVDPVLGNTEAPQSWNRYSYVFNNPVNRTDPTGRCVAPFPCPAWLGGAAGGGGAWTLGTSVAAAPVAVTIGVGVLGLTGGYAAGRGIGQISVGGKTIDERVSGAIEGIIEQGQRGGVVVIPLPETIVVISENAGDSNGSVSELPARDGTGKVHGALPTVADLREHSSEDLEKFQEELKGSVGRRIDVTSQLGPDKGHGERQAAEQRLIKQIEKILRDREGD